MLQAFWRRFVTARSLVNALTGASLLLLTCLALLLAAGLGLSAADQLGGELPTAAHRAAVSVWQLNVFPWLIFGALALAGTTWLGSVAVSRAGAERHAQERLGKAGQALEVILAEKEALLAEIHHRVKNNMQVVVNLLHLETAQLTDPGARRRLDALGQRIALIGRIHERVYASENFACMDLGAQIAEQCAELEAVRPGLPVGVRCEPFFCGVDLALPIALIVQELLNDALSHGCGVEAVEVALERQGEVAALSVSGVRGGPAELGPPGSGLTLVGLLAEQIGAGLDLGTGEDYCVRLMVPAP